MKEYIAERTKSCGLFILQVLVSITLLVLLALAVGGLPAHEEVVVQTTEGRSILKRYERIPEKWRELDQEERLWVLDAVEKEVGSTVGPIYVALGPPKSPFRSTKNSIETHLFGAYGLMLPGSPLPNVLLFPVTSFDPDDLPPPFQSPPLRDIQIRRDNVQPVGEAGPLTSMPAQVPTVTPNQRIPGFRYYNGVPLLLPRALGKIRIKMSAANRMAASTDHQ